MLKKTRSILEELDALYIERDVNQIVESRADNLITGMIRLMEFIDESYNDDDAELLNRKILNAIRARDLSKFSRNLKRVDSNEN